MVCSPPHSQSGSVQQKSLFEYPQRLMITFNCWEQCQLLILSEPYWKRWFSRNSPFIAIADKGQLENKLFSTRVLSFKARVQDLPRDAKLSLALEPFAFSAPEVYD